jgi:glycosyltransferase involved in cell wall biosynthesis
VSKEIPSDRIRLVEFVTDFRIGGTERQFVTLSKRLDPTLFDLRLACLRLRGDFLSQVEDCLPLDEYFIPSLHSMGCLLSQARFARDLRRRRIELVHTWGFYPNLFATAVAKLAGAVTVAGIRDQGDIWTPMQQRAQRWVLSLADAIVVNAAAVRDRLVHEGYDGRRVFVIRNGLDVARFNRKPRGTLHRELGLPPRAPIVAALCRLAEVKGLEQFLEAAVTLSRRFPEARFVVAGDGYHRPALERYAGELGLSDRVIFTGFRHDVPEFLSEVTISVLPSLSEALSNTLIESMAAGLPVVATRVGGNPEVVEHGVNGLLVPAREPEALAAAIARLLSQPALAQAMGRAGRQRAADHFSLERVTHETESLYLRLLLKARQRVPEALLVRRGALLKAPVMGPDRTMA